MMRMAGDGDARLLARREVIRGGFHAAVLGTIIGAATSRASASTAAGPCGGEIFAFRSRQAAELVFALTVPSDQLTPPVAPPHVVRIHAGSQSWTVTDAGRLWSATTESRVFVGLTAKLTRSGARPHRLTVVAASLTSFSSHDLPVWGEMLGGNKSRARVGNPIADALLARDPDIARVYHGMSPDSDRVMLSKSLANQISALRTNAGSPDPIIHGERLADTLLPNVLSFDFSKPVGFTFAGQNGRRPSDRVADVVETVLSGVAATGGGSGGFFQASNVFPYFLPLDA